MDLGGTERLLLLSAAFAVDAAVGYPDTVYRKIGHPVTWLGRLITYLDGTLNKALSSHLARRFGGILTLALIICAAWGVGVLVMRVAGSFSLLGLIIIVPAASALLAARSLNNHVSDVARALERDGLGAGREMVAHIVGRDAISLDEAGVSRAAIESLAENFSDGVTAPAFWFGVAGLPGMAVYKAVNTADSMIGYRSDKYSDFGWASARMDDVLNFPASRLSAMLLILAAFVTPGASARNAFTAIGRDARRHRSPNAGWPEATMAGALDLELAGPRKYNGEVVDDAMMGIGRREATAHDIRNALKLYQRAVAIGVGIVLLLAFLILKSA